MRRGNVSEEEEVEEGDDPPTAIILP